MQHVWQRSREGCVSGWGWCPELVLSAFTPLEALFCQVRQGVLGMAVKGELVILRCLIRSLSAMQFDVAEQKGHKGLPTEHCIAD